MNVIFFDPYLPSGYEKSLGISRETNLSKFLEKLDILSIHSPLSSETQNIVDEKFLIKLKKNCIIINTARGQIIDKDAIYKFLKNEHISGIGFDVYPDEPPKKSDKIYKLWSSNNKKFMHKIIFTPHNAFFNEQSYIELREKAAKTIKYFFEDKKIINQVN